MDPGSSSHFRPISGIPPPKFVETLDSPFKDNVPLVERIVQNCPDGLTAANSSSRGSDAELGLDSDDSFFDDIDKIRVLSPIRASTLQMVLLESPSKLARTHRTTQSVDRPELAPSSSGHNTREPEFGVRVNEMHPHFFNYSHYEAEHPYN